METTITDDKPPQTPPQTWSKWIWALAAFNILIAAIPIIGFIISIITFAPPCECIKSEWDFFIILLIINSLPLVLPFVALIVTLYGIRNRKKVFGRSNVIAGTAIILANFAMLLTMYILASL